MTLIAINGIIQERRDTTANWNYVNPILEDKEKGFEVDSSGLPIGMKIGDGANTWSNLPYWFIGGAGNVQMTIHAGWPCPYNIPKSQFPSITSLRPNVRQAVPGASATQDTTEGTNQLCRYNFTSSAKTTLASIDVLTVTNDGVTVATDTYIVISE